MASSSADRHFRRIDVGGHTLRVALRAQAGLAGLGRAIYGSAVPRELRGDPAGLAAARNTY